MAEQQQPNYYKRLFQTKIDQRETDISSQEQSNLTVEMAKSKTFAVTDNMKNTAKEKAVGDLKNKDFVAKALKETSSDLSIQIDEEIKSGNLPSKDFDKNKVLSEISSGKYTVDDLSYKYKRQQARNLAIEQFKPKDESAFKTQFNSKYDETMNGAKDKIKDFIMDDRLPLDRDIIARLKSRPHEIGDAMTAYDEFKKTGMFYTEPERIGDKLSAMKNSGIDTSTLEKQYADQLSKPTYYFKKFGEGLSQDIYQGQEAPTAADELIGMGVKGAGMVVGGLALSSLSGFVASKVISPALKTGALAVASAAESASESAPIIDKALTSISKGLYTASKSMDFQAVAKSAEAMNVMSKETWLLGKSAQTLGAAEEAEMAFSTSAALKSVAAKKSFNMMVKQAAIEGTIVGGVKGTKNVLKGEETLGEAISTTLTDTIFYSAGAVAFHGISKAVGTQAIKGFDQQTKEYIAGTGEKGFSLLFPSIRNKVTKEAGLLNEYLSNTTVQQLAKKGVDVNKFTPILLAGELDVDSKMALNALEKLNLMKEAMGSNSEGITPAMLMSKPELQKKVLIENSKETARNLFTGDNAPLKEVYNSNINVKNFVDSGMPIHALDTVNAGVAQKIAGGSMKAEDLLDGALQVDKDIMAKIMANKVIDSRMPSLTKDQKARLFKVKDEAAKIIAERKITNPEEMDTIESVLKDKILSEGKTYGLGKQPYRSRKVEMYDAVYRNFLDNNEESLKALENVATSPTKSQATSSKGKIFIRENQKPKKLFNKILDDIEKVKASTLKPDEVNDILNTQVSKWFNDAGGLVPEKGLIGADALLTAMTVQNQKLLEATAEAFGRNALSKSDAFQNIKTEDAQSIRAAIKLKHYEEDLSFNIKGYNAVNSEYKNALAEKADPISLASFKLRMKDLLNNQSNLRKNINEITTSLSALNTPENPNAMQELVNTAQGIYSPSLTLARVEGATIQQAEAAMMSGDKAAKTNVMNMDLRKALDSIIEPGAGKDLEFWGKADPLSPYALKQDSDVAKEMTYMMVSNADFASSYSKPIGIGGWSKASHALKKEFGEESAVSKLVVDGYKDREIAASSIKKLYFNKIKAIGLREGSLESKVAHYIGEAFEPSEVADEVGGVVSKKLNITDDLVSKRISEMKSGQVTKGVAKQIKLLEDYLSMDNGQKSKVADGIELARKSYDDLYKATNTILEQNGLKKIGFIDNYFKHFTKNNELGEEFSNYFSGKTEGFKLLETKLVNPDGSSEIFNPSSLHRKTVDTEYDLISGLQQYVSTSSRVVTFSDYVRKIDSMMNLSSPNLKEFLRHVKTSRVLGGSELDNSFFEKNSVAKRSIKFVDSMRTKAMLAFKASSALNQISSMSFAFSENGTNAVTSMMDIMNPNKKGLVNEILSKSKNLSIRNSHVAGMDNLDGAYGKVMLQIFEKAGGYSDKTAGKNLALKSTAFVSEASMYAQDVFDKLAAKHMYLSTFKTAQDMGLADDGAHRMADYAVDKFHADLSKIGRAAYQDSTLGRALFRFQSFTNNLFHGLITDLPRVEQKKGTAAMVDKMVKLAAGMEITNEVYSGIGLNMPFDSFSLIPGIGTAKFGATGVLDLAQDTARLAAAVPDKDFDKKSYEKAKRDAQKDIFGMIATEQGRRGYDVFDKLQKGGYEKSKSPYMEFMQDMVSGVKGSEINKSKQMFEEKQEKKYQRVFNPEYPRPFIKGQLRKVLK